jgi:hypothetical protein
MSSDKVVRIAGPLRPRALLGAAALAVAVSGSCVESSPAGPQATLVPADAIAAVVVESPYKLYAATEKFWEAAGLDETTGSDLQGLLEKSVPGPAEALRALDFARPWALAVLPSSGPKKTREVLYIPYRSPSADLVGKLFGSGSMRVIADAEGYLVLSDVEGKLVFPPAKGADLSRLSRYSASSLKFWADPSAIRRATSDSYRPIEEAVRRFVTPPPSVAAGGKPVSDPKAVAKAMGEFGISLLGQLGLADAAVEPGASGLILRAGVSAKSGSELQKTLSAASFAPSALDSASQLRADAMYGCAWSMDPVVASGFYARMTDALISSIGLPRDIVSKATALRAKWAKAGGPRGAVSLDMDLDASALSGAKDLKSDDPAAIAGLIKKMIRIKFDLVQEVKDEASYRALMRGLATDPDYLALSKAYADAFGLSVAVKSRDRKDGAFSYGELGIELKVVDSAKLAAVGTPPGKASTEAVLAALGPLVAARWTISNGRFVATGGDVAALESLAARKAAERNLGEDPAFAVFAKSMPRRTFMVGSLSVRKLIKEVSEVLAAGGRAGDGSWASSMPDPALFGSWYSYFAIDESSPSLGLEAGFLIPASDIGALVRSGRALLKAKTPADGA